MVLEKILSISYAFAGFTNSSVMETPNSRTVRYLPSLFICCYDTEFHYYAIFSYSLFLKRIHKATQQGFLSLLTDFQVFIKIVKMNQSVEKSAESEINEIIENHENAARLAKNRGRISLNFIDGEAVDHPDYPNSYYTFSAKERLLLIYAENIRREFCATHPNRSSLILAIPNECGIQKCVSTTIRPSVLLFPELIDNWMAMAQFVADFIVYQPFDEPTELVSLKILKIPLKILKFP